MEPGTFVHDMPQPCYMDDRYLCLLSHVSVCLCVCVCASLDLFLPVLPASIVFVSVSSVPSQETGSEERL